MKRKITLLFLLGLFCAGIAFSEEEIEYKRFKLEDASCDVGVRYKTTDEGMIVGVSALPTGKGVEFRKWSVSAIKLNIGGKRLRPDKEGKFYVTEESFFRVPGAIIFAAIGALGEYSSNDFDNAIGKVGMALGLGLIALQAKGEITGERALFNMPKELVDKIKEGADAIEITIENENLHLKNEIRIGLVKPAGNELAEFNFDRMSENDLLKHVNLLRGEIAALENEQAAYKYGQDPEYDDIQRKLEKLEAERGIAYNAWIEKRN